MRRSAVRFALRVEEAAASLGMSRDSFDRYVMPDVRVIRRGRLVLVPVRELERWCRAVGGDDAGAAMTPVGETGADAALQGFGPGAGQRAAAPRRRQPPALVFASFAVLADARELLGGGVQVENAVARSIAGGRATRTPLPGVELPDGALVARPFDANWAAIIRRSRGRLVRDRRRGACWTITRVVLLGGTDPAAVGEGP